MPEVIASGAPENRKWQIGPNRSGWLGRKVPKLIRVFCLMVSNGDRKRLPLRSKSLKWEMGEMDAPFGLRLVTPSYAGLPGLTSSAGQILRHRVPLRPGLTCTLNPPTELALGPEPFRGLLSPGQGAFWPYRRAKPMFTGVCCVSGAYRSRSAVRPRRPVSTNVYAAWHDGTPPAIRRYFGC